MAYVLVYLQHFETISINREDLMTLTVGQLSQALVLNEMMDEYLTYSQLHDRISSLQRRTGVPISLPAGGYREISSESRVRKFLKMNFNAGALDRRVAEDGTEMFRVSDDHKDLVRDRVETARKIL